jgi:hypothetical protein
MYVWNLGTHYICPIWTKLHTYRTNHKEVRRYIQKRDIYICHALRTSAKEQPCNSKGNSKALFLLQWIKLLPTRNFACTWIGVAPLSMHKGLSNKLFLCSEQFENSIARRNHNHLRRASTTQGEFKRLSKKFQYS